MRSSRGRETTLRRVRMIPHVLSRTIQLCHVTDNARTGGLRRACCARWDHGAEARALATKARARSCFVPFTLHGRTRLLNTFGSLRANFLRVFLQGGDRECSDPRLYAIDCNERASHPGRCPPSHHDHIAPTVVPFVSAQGCLPALMLCLSAVCFSAQVSNCYSTANTKLSLIPGYCA